MTTRHSVSLLAALCTVAALAGCAMAPAADAPRDSTKFTLENSGHFVVLDAATEAAVSCTGLQERTLGDGRLEVIANLKNRGSAPVRVHVQCLFQNDQGAPFSVEGSWQSLSIAGDSTEVMRFTAPDAMVKAYEIRVRKV
jgi:hypothetical protein